MILLKNVIVKGVLVFIVFLFGVGVGSSGNETIKTKEVVREVPVEKVVNVNEDTWKELKSLDDKVFVVAGESMGLCGDGFNAVAEMDLDTLESITQQIKANTSRIDSLSVDRNILLQELGY